VVPIRVSLNSWMVGNPEVATNGLEEINRIPSKPTLDRVVANLSGLNFRFARYPGAFTIGSHKVTSPSAGFEV